MNAAANTKQHASRKQGSPKGFWKPFLAFLSLGTLGVLALIPTSVTMIERLRETITEPLPPLPVLVVLSLLQSTVLLALATTLGILIAPRLGLRSHILERLTHASRNSRFRNELPLALTLGLAVGVLLIGFDAFLQPYLGESASALAEAQPRTISLTLAGVLYGGLTEELLLRWGLMTLFAWLGTLVFGRLGARPRPMVMWLSILLTALLFGVLHLPTVATITPLTSLLVARTVLLNAIGGVVFGWFYWQRSLEAGMVAHATAHIGMSLTLLVTALL